MTKVANHEDSISDPRFRAATEGTVFQWGHLDHKSIERHLDRLRRKIENEINEGERLAPIETDPGPTSFKTPRQAHTFEVLQQDRADDWVTRAYKIYLDDWQAKGRAKTKELVHAIWEHGLSYFVREDVLKYLRLVFCIDDRTKKLSGFEYSRIPQGIEATSRISAANRVYSDIQRIWFEKRIPSEIADLGILIAEPDSFSARSPSLSIAGAAAPVATVSTTTYNRTREKSLKLDLAQNALA